MVSIVIRNKNESIALQRMLPILTGRYQKDFDEIILVDNQSTDDSLKIAKSYGCKIVSISDFTYGKAINLGLSEAKNNHVLLLSSHAVPIGNSFFKSALEAFDSSLKIAGIRFVNSIGNYELAHKNDYEVKEPLENGLMAACAMINKNVWQDHKFDESLIACEDKEWSRRVINNGYYIKQVSETFFYFAKRGQKGNLKRYLIESVSNAVLKDQEPQSYMKIIGSSIYNMTIKNIGLFFKRIVYEFNMLKTKLKIRRLVKTNRLKQ